MTVPLPSHFLPKWWRESNDPEAALRKRPNHEFSWVSPVFTKTVYPLLRSALLDSERRKSDGFPASLAIYRYMQMTPAQVNQTKNTLPLPQAGSRPGVKAYAALVVDCEMVELEDRVQDLVSLSVVDFLSGEVVLNTLVQPVGRVKCWRSQITGVYPANLHNAKVTKGVLNGWPEARAKIFAVADSDTIFIGHALPNDLKILRIEADHVVDSTVILAQAAFGSPEKFPRRWSLKVACQELINVSVQAGRKPHSPLEDALATRELVLWCLTHPKNLLEWGNNARVVYEKEKEERERKAAEEKKKAQQEAAEKRKKKRLEEEARWAEAQEEVDKRELEPAASWAGYGDGEVVVVEAMGARLVFGDDR